MGREAKHGLTMTPRFLPSTALLVLLVIGGVYLFALFSLPADSFWSNDDGTKFLIVHNLAQRNSLETHIDYPAQELDPELKYQPLPPPMGFVKNGKIYGIFTNTFTLLTAFFYKRLSFGGLYLLPVFFGLASLALTALFFEKEGDKIKTLLLTAFGTPLFFYSLNFWEHTAAVFFALLAIYWAWKGCRPDFSAQASYKKYGYLLAAGLMAALTEIFRNEAYGLGIGLVLAVLWQCKSKTGVLYYLLGQTLGLLPLGLINLKAFGSPLPLHFARLVDHYGFESFWGVLSRSAWVFWTYLFGMQPVLWCGVLLAAAAFISLITALLYQRQKISPFVFMAGLSLYALAALKSFILTVTLPDPVYNAQFVNTLFSGTPYLLFLLLGINLEKEEKNKKFWAFAGIIIAAHLMFASLIPMAGGMQWGMRNHLVIYPLMLLLAVNSYKTWLELLPSGTKTFLKGFFILLMLLAFLHQGYGYTLLRLKKAEGKRLWQEVAQKSQEVLVTDLPWASQEGAAVFYQKKMLYVASPPDLRQLTADLKARGLKGFTFLTHRENTWANSPAVAALGLKTGATQNLRRPRLDYLDLLLVNYEIL